MIPLDTIVQGDCLEVMQGWPDGCVDAVVCDPPYELGFMGKSWDSTGVAYRVEVWREALRVLKPGGHLLAFGGTRTYHRMAVAIEDAGGEIRDMIDWLYGSGFPKSHPIGKAIDKAAPRAGMFTVFAAHFAERRAASDMTQKDIAHHFPSKSGGITGCVWNWENGANVPTLTQWKILQPMLGLSDDWLPLIERIEAEREVVGIQENAMSGWDMDGGTQFKDRPITAPATEAAKQWDGWGTALKPGHEPICVARKPFPGTVADNVLAHGTGGLNIDAGRVGTTDNLNGGAYAESGTARDDGWGMQRAGAGTYKQPAGRWPANVVLDPEAAAELDEQSGENCGAFAPVRRGHDGTSNGIYGDFAQKGDDGASFRGDSGGASRFFYCAKASRSERNAGAWELYWRKDADRPSGVARCTAEEWRELGREEKRIFKETGVRVSLRARGNIHSTVKPVSLMRWLIRLVTPPGGVVLDPFCGSGTTCVAAKREGYRYIGIDISPDYCDIARARVGQTEANLFAGT